MPARMISRLPQPQPGQAPYGPLGPIWPPPPPPKNPPPPSMPPPSLLIAVASAVPVVNLLTRWSPGLRSGRHDAAPVERLAGLDRVGRPFAERADAPLVAGVVRQPLGPPPLRAA